MDGLITTRAEATHYRAHVEERALNLIKETPGMTGCLSVNRRTEDGPAVIVHQFENGVWLSTMAFSLKDIKELYANLTLFSMGLA